MFLTLTLDNLLWASTNKQWTTVFFITNNNKG